MTREEQIIKASQLYAKAQQKPFMDGALWAYNSAWHDAQGDYLPEIDKEVIVIDKRGKVSYGHRPNPDGYDTKIEHIEPMIYDKGGWNIPNIRLWLDIDIPNLEQIWQQAENK